MNKKKKLALMTMALSSVAMVTACSNEEEKVVKFTEEEEIEFVQSFSELVLTPGEPAEVIKEMDENIQKVSKNEASNMIDGLLYVLHQYNQDMNNKIAGLQSKLAELDKSKVDFNDAKQIDKVEDETTKAFLKEIHERKFIIQKIGNDYYARPDIEGVLETYGSYMNDDLKTITEFSLEENNKPFYNAETNSFDMNIVVDRILRIESNMEKFPESFYIGAMQNSKNYYYQVYFGTNNSFLVDENKIVLDSIIKHYKDTVEKHPDTQIGKDTKTVLDMLKETKNEVTDNLYVSLLELTGTQTEDVEQDASTTEEKATEKVNEVIQNAIEENAKETESTDKTSDSEK